MKILTYILFLIIICPVSVFSEDTAKPLPGRTLGDQTAQIIIEEYASMSCGHCASFHNNNLDKIKKEFIDTGKAKLIFYDFPLDRGAMIGSMITQCMNDKQFFPVLNRLFQKQTEWTQSDNILESINTILNPLGLDKNRILSCLEENEENQNRWKSLNVMQFRSAPPAHIVGGHLARGRTCEHGRMKGMLANPRNKWKTKDF